MTGAKLYPFAVLAMLSVVSAEATTSERLSNSIVRLSPSDFASRVTVENDAAAGVVRLSTRRASAREGPSRDAFIDEAHARVTVEPRSDRVIFEVWHEFSYNGKLADIAAVRYRIGETQHFATPKNVEQWLSACGSDAGGSCFLSTRVSFELPEQHARAVAASYAPGSREPWLLEIEDRSGKAVTLGFAPAELAGLILAYEAWRPGSK